MLLRLVFVLSVSLLLAACVQTQATMLSSKTYTPLHPDDVVIYLAEDDIPGTYEKVALINAQGESGMTNESQMYAAARKRAAQIGANGILVEQIKEPGAGAKVAGAIFGVGTTRRGQMIAIYVHTGN